MPRLNSAADMRWEMDRANSHAELIATAVEYGIAVGLSGLTAAFLAATSDWSFLSALGLVQGIMSAAALVVLAGRAALG